MAAARCLWMTKGSTRHVVCMMGCVSVTESRSAPGVLPSSPRATRHRGGAWRDPRLLVGVVLIAASGLAGAVVLSGDETVDVWAARTGASAGEPVAVDTLVRREVRFADQADANRYVSADQPFPAGATFVRDVGAGELVPRAAVTTDAAAPVLEVPLRVTGEAVPSSVRTGSRVDVWVTPGPEAALEGGADARTARIVLEDVAVLAVSRAGSALGPAAERQVIVGLEETREAELADALGEMATGSVVLVRRP